MKSGLKDIIHSDDDMNITVAVNAAMKSGLKGVTCTGGRCGSSEVAVNAAMKSGLKGTISCGVRLTTSGSSECRDEKRTERILTGKILSFDCCSSECRDEKRTESKPEQPPTTTPHSSSECRDEKRTESLYFYVQQNCLCFSSSDCRDEKRTERRAVLGLRQPAQVATYAPMKRGLKDKICNNIAAQVEVATYAPTKRGLKVSLLLLILNRSGSSNLCPDEKGTERR